MSIPLTTTEHEALEWLAALNQPIFDVQPNDPVDALHRLGFVEIRCTGAHYERPGTVGLFNPIVTITLTTAGREALHAPLHRR